MMMYGALMAERERERAMEWKTRENYRLNLSRHNSSMTTLLGRREEKQDRLW